MIGKEIDFVSNKDKGFFQKRFVIFSKLLSKNIPLCTDSIHIVVADVEKIHKQPCSFDMSEKIMSEPPIFARTFDKSGNVCNDNTVIRHG